MINLNKHLSFFDPLNDIKHPIHIIGCGAIGSTLAEMLTRMGVPKLHLYDFDEVSPHNIANQMFRHADIGEAKTIILNKILTEINPNIECILHTKGYIDQKLAGHVFLCVDNIDLRRKICEDNKYNTQIKSMYDFRMRLTDAQHYAADWSDPKSIENLINTMQFTHEEAKESTPINACGTSLNIIPTVRMIVSLGLGNFINFIKDEKTLKKMIIMDAFNAFVEAY